MNGLHISDAGSFQGLLDLDNAIIHIHGLFDVLTRLDSKDICNGAGLWIEESLEVFVVNIKIAKVDLEIRDQDNIIDFFAVG